MTNTAYQATPEDLENILRNNKLLFARTVGKSVDALAIEFFDSLDFDLIEKAALSADSLDQQTQYANDEIARQLRQMGILEFDPDGPFTSPNDALVQIHLQASPIDALLALVKAQVEMDECGFAAEVVQGFNDEITVSDNHRGIKAIENDKPD